ncbi:response regulator [bacterium]|nr:response regulator [bacterium]
MKSVILLVDDSKVFLELEKNILSDQEYTIFEARNGKVALELAKTHHPDLILLDINMPVMNGFELLVLLKNDDRLRNIPVIVVTTRGRETDVEYALKLGADDYITKPIDNRTLIWKVASLSDHVKKRSTPRIPLDIEIDFGKADDHFTGIIKDLSIGGAHIVTSENVKKLEQYEFVFSVPFEGGYRPIRTMGKIIYKAKSSTGEQETYDLRVQFINLNREALFFIENLINKDTHSLASFLFTSPSQRQDYHNTVAQNRQPSKQILINELDSLLDEFYYIESIKSQFLSKYDLLKNHLKEVQLDFNELGQRYSQREEDYLSLSNLFVAVYQLFTRNTVSGFSNVLCDIIENLVGAEKFELFLYIPETGTFKSLLSPDQTKKHTFAQAITEQLHKGELYLTDMDQIKSRLDQEPVIAVPLMLNNDLLGVIVIFSFLPQITKMSDVTLQLLEILSKLGGMALITAHLLDKMNSSDKSALSLIESLYKS